MPAVTVTLDEIEWQALAAEAARQGLSTDEMIHRLVASHLRAEARERAWREQLGAAFDDLHASLPPIDPAEIEAEITAARAEVASARVARRS
jgi:hypothetical protein